MTVDAMRQAVVAIRAGAFDVGYGVAGAFGDGPVATALGGVQPIGGRLPWPVVESGRSVVVVLAGHAGAGASTVALAVAEGLAESRRVELVEYAEPARSGLVAASSVELEADGGWRKGRRGGLDIFRLAEPVADEAPRPPASNNGERVLVVDAGRSLTAALLDADSRELLPANKRVVVVTRMTVPGVRQTEQLLAVGSAEAWVAAVGPRSWPPAVAASCGPRLRSLRADGRVVRVPLDARLQVSGLTGDPLPRSVATAGRSLAELVVPTGPSSRREQGAASPRWRR